MVSLQDLMKKKVPKKKETVFIIQKKHKLNKRKQREDKDKNQENNVKQKLTDDFHEVDMEKEFTVEPKRKNTNTVAIVDKRMDVIFDRDMILKRLYEKDDVFIVKQNNILVAENTVQSKIPVLEMKKMGEIEEQEEKEENDQNKEMELIPKPFIFEPTEKIIVKKRKYTRRLKQPLQDKIINEEDILNEPIEKKKNQTRKKRDVKEKGDKEKEKGDKKKEKEEKEEKEKEKEKEEKEEEEEEKEETSELNLKMKINGVALDKRLPKKEKILIKTSNYYMNNRKKYIQTITKLFRPYQKELEKNEKENNDISCDRPIGSSIELFIHQRVVREYLNVMTPYRGLLLYHGLGSGKTCTSIAIAEGMKTHKNIVLMTPASLKMNYFSELKKCGDPMFKKNQFWEFISFHGKPEYPPLFSRILQIPLSEIRQKNGVWLVNMTKKESNFDTLSTEQQKELDHQLNQMIRSKYQDINYNGITKTILKNITKNDTINPFDNKTVIIDEAHNFVSRIVNKLQSPTSTSYILYHHLMKATNVKIILLTGTPIVNYPNEIGVLFNILRGYIQTWTLSLAVNANAPENFVLNTENIIKVLTKEKINTFDYLEFIGNKLIITRNPYGFVHAPVAAKTTDAPQRGKTEKKGGGGDVFRIKDGVLKINNSFQKKVSNIDNINLEFDPDNKEHGDIDGGGNLDNEKYMGGSPYIQENYDGVYLDETGNISNEEFIQQIRRCLQRNNIDIMDAGSKIEYHKTLPDNKDEFIQMFINEETKTIRNEYTLNKRILGLTSYFRSANEKLLPRFILSETGEKYHVIKCPMNEYQFSYYQKIRKTEVEQESRSKKNAARNKNKEDSLYQISSSYRMFSRAACNFAFPDPPGRPLPEKIIDLEPNQHETDIDEINQGNPEIDESDDESINENETKEERQVRKANREENIGEEYEDDDNKKPSAKDKKSYLQRIDEAMQTIEYDPSKTEEDQHLTKTNLPKYSQKMVEIVSNLTSPENEGLHLLYSNFLTVEGIGILKLILQANRFAEFKLKKNSSNEWEINNFEEIKDKSKFVLYTGKETIEEKEIIRNIYNSNWEFVPSSINTQLRSVSTNNHYGEIIKIIMITASGSEGINLKNTRFVHITEPYWNMSRIEQVIGRARRICSHQDLPEEMRTVKVFFYITVFSQEQTTNKQNIELMLHDKSRIDSKRSITTDENLYEIAMLKTKINNDILRSVKQTSIDCSLYNSSVSDETANEKLVCYNFGKVNSNDFSSRPSIQEDLRLEDSEDLNIRQEVLKFKMIPAKDPKYAMDSNTFILYSIESYKRAKKNQQMGMDLLERVGKVEQIKVGRKMEYKIVLDGNV